MNNCRFPHWKKKLYHLPMEISGNSHRNFWSNGKCPWYGNLLGKFPENLEIVRFPKSEPFNQKFQKFRDENKMEWKFPGKNFENVGIPHEVVLFFVVYANSNNFYSVIASSFGRNHSKYSMTEKTLVSFYLFVDKY